MQEIDLLERLADCVRLGIEAGEISPKSAAAIAWRDYSERFEAPQATATYRNELAKICEIFRKAGIEFKYFP